MTGSPERTIQITVSPEGTVSIKTQGFHGAACKDATKDIERALGVVDRESLLPEYFNRTSATEQLRQGQ